MHNEVEPVNGQSRAKKSKIDGGLAQCVLRWRFVERVSHHVGSPLTNPRVKEIRHKSWARSLRQKRKTLLKSALIA